MPLKFGYRNHEITSINYIIRIFSVSGARFGLMQSKVGLALLLNEFEFSLSPKTQVPITYNNNSLILATRGGMWLDARKLNSSAWTLAMPIFLPFVWFLPKGLDILMYAYYVALDYILLRCHKAYCNILFLYKYRFFYE